MRYLFIFSLLAALGYGAWQWYNGKIDPLKVVQQTLDTGNFPTLEIRYSAEQIMEVHRRELIKDTQHKYLTPELKFYPYLLMEVKFTSAKQKTKEGVLLWDLVDGERVIDTSDWKKTHGFGDCIKAAIDKNEFKLLLHLSRKEGLCDREALLKSLNVENETLDQWLDSCRKKKLIVSSGNKYRLHIERPLLDAAPETLLEDNLVTKSFKNASRTPRRFSLSQIQLMCRAAFGNDFVIRKTTPIYLPVHCIVVQNPDGSVHTTHWNALNGKKLSQDYYLE